MLIRILFLKFRTGIFLIECRNYYIDKHMFDYYNNPIQSFGSKMQRSNSRYWIVCRAIRYQERLI